MKCHPQRFARAQRDTEIILHNQKSPYNPFITYDMTVNYIVTV